MKCTKQTWEYSATAPTFSPSTFEADLPPRPEGFGNKTITVGVMLFRRSYLLNYWTYLAFNPFLSSFYFAYEYWNIELD